MLLHPKVVEGIHSLKDSLDIFHYYFYKNLTPLVSKTYSLKYSETSSLTTNSHLISPSYVPPLSHVLLKSILHSSKNYYLYPLNSIIHSISEISLKYSKVYYKSNHNLSLHLILSLNYGFMKDYVSLVIDSLIKMTNPGSSLYYIKPLTEM